MPLNINEIFVAGTLIDEPTTKQMQNGILAEFVLAVKERWTDRQTGQPKEKINNIPIQTFGQQAENVRAKLHKGMNVYVKGQIKTRDWTSPEGKFHRFIQIDAYKIQPITVTGSTPPKQHTQQSNQYPPQNQQQQYQQQPLPSSNNIDPEYNEDVPF